MDQSGVIERRSSRSNVMLQATLEIPGFSHPVILRNLSKDGALVRGEDLPEAGTRILFHRQGLSVPGQVAWVHGHHAGLSFDQPLFPKEMLRHIPCMVPKPLPIETRRPGLGSSPLTEAERRIVEQWASSDSPYTLGE